MLKTRRGAQEGFTLIEIIIGIILLSVLGLFSMRFLTDIFQVSQMTAGQKDMVDQAKMAMEEIVREVRFSKTVTNTATSISFDKLAAYPQEAGVTTGISYNWNSALKQLTRTSTTGTFVVATDVSAFQVTNSANLYTIVMTLTSPQNETFTLESAVRPRSTI